MSRRVPYVLGVDLGGTRMKLLAITPDGRMLARKTAASGDRHWQKNVRAAVASLAVRLGPPRAIGAAAPGLAAPDERSIAFMPGRLPGLEDLDWTRFLGAHRTVPVVNDAHAALLGEHWCGAAQGADNVLLLTLGTGVGGAVLANGRLLRGHLGRAGHIGHMTVNAGGPGDLVGTPGSLEDAVGNHSLSLRTRGRFTDTATLVSALAGNDSLARRTWARMIRDLAAALASLINLFDPERIVIGGGIAEADDALFVPLARALDRVEWRPGGARVQIVKAALGDFAGAYGAARRALVLHEFTA